MSLIFFTIVFLLLKRRTIKRIIIKRIFLKKNLYENEQCSLKTNIIQNQLYMLLMKRK